MVDGPEKKKPRLEYLPIPLKPTYKPRVIQKDVKKDVRSVTSTSTATYIPTKIVPAELENNEAPVQEVDNNDDEKLIIEKTESENHKEKLTDDNITSEIIEVTSNKDNEKEKDKTDRKSSSSSRSRHSSSSSSRSKHHKKSSSSKDESSSRHHHKSSSHKSSRHKSSRSSSRSRESSSRSDSKKNEKRSKEKSENKKCEKKVEELPVDIVSDEEDIEEQCRKIFETYEAPSCPVELPSSSKSSDNDENPPTSISTCEKKRFAHENAATVARPTTNLKPNHTHSALTIAHQRQDLAMQNALEELKQKEEEIKRLEAEIKKRQEEKDKLQLTPLVNPLVFQRPRPRPLISKVSQLMIIEAAKKRVADLQKAKTEKFKSFTPAQTSWKGSSRVAHAPTGISDIDPVKLAPPIKEPNSTKISSNVRNQYYKIMVTHCVQIYKLPEDAYERAQNEEFTVFQKCKMVQTYKTSVLLAINRLKKEAEANGEKNHKIFSHDVMLAGKQGLKASWSQNHKIKVNDSESSLVTIDNCSSSQAYELFHECILNEQQMRENGFPRPTQQIGRAQLFTPKKKKPASGREGDYYCSRCHNVFNTDIFDEPAADLCNYHLKRSGYRRGFSDNLHYCCQQPAGTDGW